MEDSFAIFAELTIYNYPAKTKKVATRIFELRVLSILLFPMLRTMRMKCRKNIDEI